MSENSEKCEKLGENFEPDEKKFFDDVLTKIDNFIKKYTSLLSELKEISNRNDEYVDKEIYKIFDKIGELYPETYQNIVDDVNKKLEEFNQHLEGMNS
jgi:translation elongation factor EF-G